MSRFPPTATKVGTTERLMQENEVGPDDDDGDEDAAADAPILSVLEEP